MVRFLQFRFNGRRHSGWLRRRFDSNQARRRAGSWSWTLPTVMHAHTPSTFLALGGRPSLRSSPGPSGCAVSRASVVLSAASRSIPSTAGLIAITRTITAPNGGKSSPVCRTAGVASAGMTAVEACVVLGARLRLHVMAGSGSVGALMVALPAGAHVCPRASAAARSIVQQGTPVWRAPVSQRDYRYERLRGQAPRPVTKD
jgi:hypothetical protein